MVTMVGMLWACAGHAGAAPSGAGFPQHAKYDGKIGEADATTLARQGQMTLLGPGLPSGREYMVRFDEYDKAGIKWTVTGATEASNVEQYRNAFNEVMFVAIEKKLGKTFLERMERRIEKRVRENN